MYVFNHSFIRRLPIQALRCAAAGFVRHSCSMPFLALVDAVLVPAPSRFTAAQTDGCHHTLIRSALCICCSAEMAHITQDSWHIPGQGHVIRLPYLQTP